MKLLIRYYKNCIPALLLNVLALMLFLSADGQEIFNLETVKSMAVSHNPLLGISQHQITESRDSLAIMRSNYYPHVSANAAYLFNDNNNILINQGALGVISGIPIPPQNYTIKAKNNIFIGGVTAMQPLTQLMKITTGVRAAVTSVSIAEQKHIRSVQQLSQGAEKLYFGILISQKQLQQAQLNIELINLQLYDVQSALLAGKTDSVQLYGLQAKLSGQQQQVMQLENQLENYKADLNVLMGRDAQQPLMLSMEVMPVTDLQPVTYYQQEGDSNNEDLKIAALVGQKAQFGVKAAKKEYLPDVSVFAGYSYNDILDILPNNTFTGGVLLSWNILDFGARKMALHQRLTQQKEAEENIAYTKMRANADLVKAYRKVNQSAQLINAAFKTVTFRQRELKLKKDAHLAGKVLKQEVLATENDLVQAETDLFAAQLNYRLALSDLEISAGIYH